MNVGISKGYKHFRSDLHALYLEREDMELEWENDTFTNGYITMTNCSNKDKRFYIEVSYRKRQDDGKEIEKKLFFDQIYHVGGGDSMCLQLVNPVEDI